MSLYTEEVQAIVKLNPAPLRGFVVDYVEHADYLEMRVYRDNIESYSEPQKLNIATWLYQTRDLIRATGVKCHIQGSESSPPNLRRGK